MRFGERIGVVPQKMIQRDSMNDDLRNSIWNMLYNKLFSETSDYMNNAGYSSVIELQKRVIVYYLKKPSHLIEDYIVSNINDMIYKWIKAAEWYKIYELVEFIIGEFPIDSNYYRYFDFEYDNIAKHEMSAWRLVNGRFVEITSENELEELKTSLSDDRFPGVQQHLSAALELMAQKPEPDYRNSIKESISAVESMAMNITGDPNHSLGQALDVMFKDKGLHPALKKGFGALYGYTSNAEGIRHAMLDNGAAVTAAEARFFLISCSAFVNYLKSLIPA